MASNGPIYDDDISVWKVIREELHHFARQTTLRSLPKIVAARSYRARFIWLFWFVVLFSGAMLCCYLLIINFLQFTSSFETRNDYNLITPFPSITICPHRPLSRLGKRLVKRWTPKWYFESYGKWAIEYEKKMAARNRSTEPPIALPTVAQYYQLFPSRSYIKKIGKRMETTLLSCSANLVSTVDQRKRCNESAIKLTLITEPNHFNCFMATIPEEHFRSANGIFFLLNLENYRTSTTRAEDLKECINCIWWQPKTWQTGVRVVIHPVNTRPAVQNAGIDLSAGSINIINFQSTVIRRLPAPYGTCDDSMNNDIIHDKGDVFKYTPEDCIQRKLQEAIIDHCRCVDPTLPLLEVGEAFTGYCEFYPWYVRITGEHLWKTRCLLNIREIFDYDAAKKACKTPCEKHQYATKVSSTLGFDRSIMLMLYDWMMKEGLINNKVPNMEKLLKMIEMGNMPEALDTILTSGDFMRNFVVISILRSDFMTTVLEERAAFQLPNLFSMIGGVCSLFIGFGVFVIFEFAELIFRLLVAMRSYVCLGGPSTDTLPRRDIPRVVDVSTM